MAMSEQSRYLRPIRLGLSIGTFLIVGYLGCLALALVVPGRGLHQPWLQFLPGFTWTWAGILFGLAESFAYGFFTGVVFAPIYNMFNVEGSR
jgi:hypothetical protein